MLKVVSLWHEPKEEALLKEAGLLDIDTLSKREFEWFEAPNKRRGGWSGVTRIVLNPTAPDTEQKAVFLKIQQNHFYRSWRNCFKRRLSYEREFIALTQLLDRHACVPQPLVYSKWVKDKDQGCLLIMNSLDGWTSLDKWLKSTPSNKRLRKILDSLALALRQLHREQWAHFGLFQKHVFLNPGSDTEHMIKLIDFEKARKTLTQRQAIIEDISRFLRHSQNIDLSDKLYFLRSYFETEQFSPQQTRLIRAMRGAPPI